jgi:colanic acid/amylovoran biosynthesis protein
MTTVCLFGAADDTGNLGVSALNRSFLDGMHERRPDTDIVVFDHGIGERRIPLGPAGDDRSYVHRGLRVSKRIHRRENLVTGAVLQRLGRTWGSVATSVRDAAAVADVSAGDSFSDLYGRARFELVALPKEITLRTGTPLVLLPQTYGPFTSGRLRQRAADIVRRATMAWARDEHSFNALLDLLGNDFDPDRHRSGVDMAFLLAPTAPPEPHAAASRKLLARRQGEFLAGVNVSGLLYNDTAARERYSLKLDYRQLAIRLVDELLDDGDVVVVLVPHVVVASGNVESDLDACLHLRAQIPSARRQRVLVAPEFREPGEAKWLIGQLDWFCGTRMHATIAGLSSGVPTAAVAYSPKTQGVFETCGAGAAVADPRRARLEPVLDVLRTSWHERDNGRAALGRALPMVQATGRDQFDAIAEALTSALVHAP